MVKRNKPPLPKRGVTKTGGFHHKGKLPETGGERSGEIIVLEKVGKRTKKKRSHAFSNDRDTMVCEEKRGY